MFCFVFLTIEFTDIAKIIGFTLITITVISLCSLFFTFFFLRKYRMRGNSDKFEIAGFAYEKKQDIFYSVIDAWQRDYGYCHFYDEMATPLSMVIDSEPIIFKYNNQLWLIELWKGQYGMTTGAEIGIYKANPQNKKHKKILFNAVSNKDLLNMSYVLMKNNKYYFLRSDKHWWLTGFKLGDFANPEELKMYITITFSNLNMCYAFVNELLNVGYTKDQIKIEDNKVAFVFDKPYSKQAFTRMGWIETISQWRNKMFVDEYRRLTAGADTFPEKINLLKQKNNKLYNRILNIGLPKTVYAPVAFLKKGNRREGE